MGKQNIMDVATSRNISYINRNVLLPCLVFNSIVTNLHYTDIKEIAIFCFCVVVYVLVGALVFLLLTGFGRFKTLDRTWHYGSAFALMFSTGLNLVVGYIQSLENASIFSADEINRGVGFTFIAFAMVEFLVYNLNGQALIKWDFDKKSIEQVDNSQDSDSGEKPSEVPAENNDDNVSSITSISSSDESHIREDNEPKPLSESGGEEMFRPVSKISELSHESSHSQHLRAIEIRKLPSQNVTSIVQEFAAPEMDVNALELARLRSNKQPMDEPILDKLRKAFFSSSKNPNKLHYKPPTPIMTFFSSLLNPFILSTLVSFGIAMIPWLQALFVPLTSLANSRNVYSPSYHEAPDQQPPLNLFMNYASYIGGAQVPISLFLLAATLSHLDFVNYDNTSRDKKLKLAFKETLRSFRVLFFSAPSSLYPLILLAIIKLCVMPIIGISIISAFRHWISNHYDDVLILVMCLFWALPSYVSQVYISAVYTDVQGTFEHLHLLSCFLYLEFLIFLVSFPFVSSYVLKHVLDI